MAWTLTRTVKGADFEAHIAITNNAADTQVAIPHELRRAPVAVVVTPKNTNAVAAQFFIDGVDDTQVVLNKTGGVGANAEVDVYLQAATFPYTD